MEMKADEQETISNRVKKRQRKGKGGEGKVGEGEIKAESEEKAPSQISLESRFE